MVFLRRYKPLPRAEKRIGNKSVGDPVEGMVVGDFVLLLTLLYAMVRVGLVTNLTIGVGETYARIAVVGPTVGETFV